jgi:hypothetical protein
MLTFIIGAFVGAALASWAFYQFYHVNVVTDLKRIIDELKTKLP